MKFQVALLQLAPTGSQEQNREKGIAACRQAAAMGADLALFPEMWNIGYDIDKTREAFRAAAVGADSGFITTFQNLAAELDMAIGITCLEAWEPSPRNSLMVFDRFGRRVLTYAKVHTCDFDSEHLLTPGDDFQTAELDTALGAVRIGAMICYDREFPESARILMLKGAEIVLVPNACPMEINRLSQLRTRAYENMIGIATVNYPYDHPDCNGHSSAFDGIAYRPLAAGSDETGSRDMLVLEAGEAEGIYLAAFPMDELRDYRRREIHGNAYRHPGKYGLLLSDAVEAPFLREDARR